MGKKVPEVRDSAVGGKSLTFFSLIQIMGKHRNFIQDGSDSGRPRR
jgi:hypothetical protein